MLSLLTLLFSLCAPAICKTVVYDWDITWVSASPDNYTRPVIGINGKWPCPLVEVDIGDRLVVNVHNGLGNQSTGLHWHGLYQKGTNVMDGSTGESQCPVPPGHSVTYDFFVNQPGTYWYHSHNMGQYPDGLRGPLIVHDAAAPYAGKIDGEIIFTMSDWWHEQMPSLINTYQSTQEGSDNPTGVKLPTPDVNLINDKTNAKICVEPNKTYLVRMINMGNAAGQAVYFDGHPFTAVEIDGTYVDQTYVGNKNIRIATGQRWSFLITTKNSTAKNFAIFTIMDLNMLFPPNGIPPEGYNPNGTAYLVYDDKKPLPPPVVLHEFDFFDDFDLVPSDHQALLEPVDHRILMNTGFTDINGISRALINNVTYLPQRVPSLYSALSLPGNYSKNPKVYGQVNPFVLKHKEVVEIIVNNNHANLHPWHLHGHDFQVVQRSNPNTGPFAGLGTLKSVPMKRDTIMANMNSHLVIRFRADNPGVWYFHCHIEWHIESGLIATMIEAPELIPSVQRPIPRDFLEACKAYPLGTRGNAAGNVLMPLNLNGSNTKVLPGGVGANYPPIKPANLTNTS